MNSTKLIWCSKFISLFFGHFSFGLLERGQTGQWSVLVACHQVELRALLVHAFVFQLALHLGQHALYFLLKSFVWLALGNLFRSLLTVFDTICQALLAVQTFFLQDFLGFKNQRWNDGTNAVVHLTNDVSHLFDIFGACSGLIFRSEDEHVGRLFGCSHLWIFGNIMPSVRGRLDFLPE